MKWAEEGGREWAMMGTEKRVESEDSKTGREGERRVS